MKKGIFVLFLMMSLALVGCGGEEVPFTAGTYQAEGATAIRVEVRDRRIEVLPAQGAARPSPSPPTTAMWISPLKNNARPLAIFPAFP